MAERLNSDNFEEKVGVSGRKLALVEFYSDSCVPCKKMSPVLAQLEEEYADTLFVGKVNIAYETELVERYRVQSTPTFLLFLQGSKPVRLTGVIGKEELEEKITALLGAEEKKERE